MEIVPLALNILELTPTTLIPSQTDPLFHHLPDSPLPTAPPPQGFAFSPTPNYPPPLGIISLGSRLKLQVALENIHRQQHAVLGVKMMVEIQMPTGRYRLGEIVHGRDMLPDDPPELPEDKSNSSPVNEQLPELPWGESIELGVEGEMKDLGLGVIVCSVAWETLDGRRTFQRFFKFNVVTPLGIKTRIQTPVHPNALLNVDLRENIYLEVFMQNISSEAMRILNIGLEPVQGLEVGRIGQEIVRELSVGGTRQYLFILSPVPRQKSENQSMFPPAYAPGTILPLGKLALEWISGPYHTPGKLLTSMLNRRSPLSASSPTSVKIYPTIGSTVAPSLPGKSPSSRPTTPARGLVSSIPQLPLDSSVEKKEKEAWEYDLVLSNPGTVSVEEEFTLKLRLAIRSSRPIQNPTSPPFLPKFGIQYLTPFTSSPLLPLSLPHMSLSSPSWSVTPGSPSLTDTNLARPFSPLTPGATKDGSEREKDSNKDQWMGSRPMTPIRSELKSAVSTLMRPSTPGATMPGSRERDGLGFLGLSSAKIRSMDSVGTNVDGRYGGQGEVTWPPPPIVLSNPNYKPSISIPSPNVRSDNAPKQQIQFQQIQQQTRPQTQTDIHHLGTSMFIPSFHPLKAKVEALGTIPSPSGEKPDKDKEFWETYVEWEWRFFSFDEGLGILGGLRVLIFDDSGEGEIGREWDCLGDILIT
ncbi:hypothetical protein L204_104054 [Cryptococcus depauperatus]|nr:hypothetical protein L204_03207 [Cryptococcus depauperatus CBS 7855]